MLTSNQSALYFRVSMYFCIIITSVSALRSSTHSTKHYFAVSFYTPKYPKCHILFYHGGSYVFRIYFRLFQRLFQCDRSCNYLDVEFPSTPPWQIFSNLLAYVHQFLATVICGHLAKSSPNSTHVYQFVPIGDGFLKTTVLLFTYRQSAFVPNIYGIYI